jgi:hypothetical protein
MTANPGAALPASSSQSIDSLIRDRTKCTNPVAGCPSAARSLPAHSARPARDDQRSAFGPRPQRIPCLLAPMS